MSPTKAAIELLLAATVFGTSALGGALYLVWLTFAKQAERLSPGHRHEERWFAIAYLVPGVLVTIGLLFGVESSPFYWSAFQLPYLLLDACLALGVFVGAFFMSHWPSGFTLGTPRQSST